jgi:hypothetical protein
LKAVIDCDFWQPETVYQPGDVVKSDSMPNGTEAVMVATKASVTSNVEPQWGAVGGANVSDGACFWKLRWQHWSKENATNRLPNTSYAVGNVVYDKSNLSVALKCTTAGTTSSSELDISTKAVGDTVTDGSVVWEVVKRDVSQDVADNLEYLLKKLKKYLPLAGGQLNGNLAVVNKSGSSAESSLIFLDKDDITKYASFYFDGNSIGVWQNSAVGELACKATNGVKDSKINEAGDVYIDFYGGIQIRMGHFDATANYGGTVTFPKPFGTYCLGVVLTHYVQDGVQSNAKAAAMTNKTNTNFNYVANGVTTPSIRYIAWGY